MTSTENVLKHTLRLRARSKLPTDHHNRSPRCLDMYEHGTLTRIALAFHWGKIWAPLCSFVEGSCVGSRRRSSRVGPWLFCFPWPDRILVASHQVVEIRCLVLRWASGGSRTRFDVFEAKIEVVLGRGGGR